MIQFSKFFLVVVVKMQTQMKKVTKSIINNHLEITIILFSMLMIAFMIIGGCNEDGNKSKSTPPPTGPPPGCESIEIDPECPAVSYTELCPFWGSYDCNFSEISQDLNEPENISLVIQLTDCLVLDCFKIECEEMIPPNEYLSIIKLNILELITISDILPEQFKGFADIDGKEFEYVCDPPPIP